MRYIDTLKEKDQISGVYLCKFKQINVAKNGKEYGSIILQDKTGTIDGKIWDLYSMGIEDFDAMDYVSLDAEVTLFNEKNQLKISRIRKARESEYTVSDYLPVSNKNIDEMFAELKNKIMSIKDKAYRTLLTSLFIDDTDFASKFCFSSAAKTVHHSFVGGLLEHTLSVVNICEYFCTAYPMIKRDLLITAAICHDIGKIKELSVFPENDYTDEGQLVGHIVIGTNIIFDRAKDIEDLSNKKLNELIHCIVSHHGELEYGSPKKPAILEAFALSFADNTDAKMQTVIEYLNAGKDNSSWLGFNRLLDSNIRKTSI